MKENPQGLQDKNWIIDQMLANNGSINYCVRWNHSGNSTATARASTVKALQHSLQKWFDVLVGFEGFPLTTMNVDVVGYAVKNKNLLEGDVSGLDVYTTTDGDGVPECDPHCYRAIHLDGDMSQCPGGKESRYDISLWLDESLTGDIGGYGYNWGQELSPTYFLGNVDSDNIHILLHEMGHGFGLLGMCLLSIQSRLADGYLDFYDWVPQGQTSFIMMAGSAMEITEFDAWMLRDWYRKLKAARGW